MVPWEVLRQVLDQLPSKERQNKAGRKAIDLMVLFKRLILKQLYNLSNEEVTYQAHDRASTTATPNEISPPVSLLMV